MTCAESAAKSVVDWCRSSLVRGSRSRKAARRDGTADDVNAHDTQRGQAEDVKRLLGELEDFPVAKKNKSEPQPLSSSVRVLEGAPCPWREMAGAAAYRLGAWPRTTSTCAAPATTRSACATTRRSFALGASIPCGRPIPILPQSCFSAVTRKMKLANEALYSLKCRKGASTPPRSCTTVAAFAGRLTVAA